MERFLRWIIGLFNRSLVGIILLLYIPDRLGASGTVIHALVEPGAGAVVFLLRKLLEHSACITNLILARVLGILAGRGNGDNLKSPN